MQVTFVQMPVMGSLSAFIVFGCIFKLPQTAVVLPSTCRVTTFCCTNRNKEGTGHRPLWRGERGCPEEFSGRMGAYKRFFATGQRNAGSWWTDALAKRFAGSKETNKRLQCTEAYQQTTYFLLCTEINILWTTLQKIIKYSQQWLTRWDYFKIPHKLQNLLAMASTICSISIVNLYYWNWLGCKYIHCLNGSYILC